MLDFVEGHTLRARLVEANGPLTVAETQQIARQICSGLSYAHREGLLHRDIKPENILLTTDGRAFLSDFGLARAEAASSSQSNLVGTPSYIAPERWRRAESDARSDLYALGVMLYEMLAGRRPFRGETGAVRGDFREKLQYEHMQVEPPLLTALNPTVPAQVAAAIQKCLAKRPEDRYQQVSDLLRDLEGTDAATRRFRLTVNTDLPSAQVFLGGVWQGAAPLNIPDMPSGNHTLHIAMPGYQGKTVQVAVLQDQTVMVALGYVCELRSCHGDMFHNCQRATPGSVTQIGRRSWVVHARHNGFFAGQPLGAHANC